MVGVTTQDNRDAPSCVSRVEAFKERLWRDSRSMAPSTVVGVFAHESVFRVMTGQVSFQHTTPAQYALVCGSLPMVCCRHHAKRLPLPGQPPSTVPRAWLRMVPLSLPRRIITRHEAAFGEEEAEVQTPAFRCLALLGCSKPLVFQSRVRKALDELCAGTCDMMTVVRRVPWHHHCGTA